MVELPLPAMPEGLWYARVMVVIEQAPRLAGSAGESLRPERSQPSSSAISGRRQPRFRPQPTLRTFSQPRWICRIDGSVATR